MSDAEQQDHHLRAMLHVYEHHNSHESALSDSCLDECTGLCAKVTQAHVGCHTVSLHVVYLCIVQEVIWDEA